ncbi:DUF2859 domain-containing protein [Ottowia flava]|uniref:DUF2859 domain-containing protein n=1 Tax=Ottowia flava TaxID=2675430 RepID=A0ABW4L233_9BURK
MRQPTRDRKHPDHDHQARQPQHPQKAVGRPQPGQQRIAAAATRLGALARRHLQVQHLPVLQGDDKLKQRWLARHAARLRFRGADQIARGVAHHHLARRLRQALAVALLICLVPGPADQQAEHRHAAGHRQPDAQVQLAGNRVGQAHARQSCCLAKT